MNTSGYPQMMMNTYFSVVARIALQCDYTYLYAYGVASLAALMDMLEDNQMVQQYTIYADGQPVTQLHVLEALRRQVTRQPHKLSNADLSVFFQRGRLYHPEPAPPSRNEFAELVGRVSLLEERLVKVETKRSRKKPKTE